MLLLATGTSQFINPRVFSLPIDQVGRLEQVWAHSVLIKRNADGVIVLWKVTPLVAGWLASPQNFLFRFGILDSASTVLELGSGTSGVIASTISPLVKSFICTDQKYALGLLEQNLSENRPQRKIARSKKESSNSNVEVLPLDWEFDTVTSIPHLLRSKAIDVSNGFDAVISCDCIYNEALVEPFVQTCREICRLRQASVECRPTLCIIAQQIRSSDVMERWLGETLTFFRLWRVPDELLDEGLRENTGFVVHLALLKPLQQPI